MATRPPASRSRRRTRRSSPSPPTGSSRRRTSRRTATSSRSAAMKDSRQVRSSRRRYSQADGEEVLTPGHEAPETDEAKAMFDEDAEAKPATKSKAKPRATKRAAPKATPADPLDVPLFDSAGERQGEVRLPKLIFAEKVNTPVMHQAFVRQANNARQGTASTKTRETASGGGAKPYRHKRTGRARHRSIREAPLTV